MHLTTASTSTARVSGLSLLACTCGRSAASSTGQQRRGAAAAAKKTTKPGAKAPTKKSGFSNVKSDSRAAEGSDNKFEAVKKFLYGTTPTIRKAQNLARAEAVDAAIPSLGVHETIMRAWQLHRRQVREQREAEMQARYDSMQAAIAELEKTDVNLFRLATGGPKFSTIRHSGGEEGKQASLAGRMNGLFPRQMPVMR
ncbi:hypothetical protein EMMF5_002668 [Cystobasidiomycetes sp. EMM_F5]